MNNELFKCPIEWLMYRSYEWNRHLNPNLDPLIMRKYYPDAETYEKIYQEKTKEIQGN